MKTALFDGVVSVVLTVFVGSLVLGGLVGVAGLAVHFPRAALAIVGLCVCYLIGQAALDLRDIW